MPTSRRPELLLDQCKPAIEATVRKKLRVTLRKDDFRKQNQDAFDLIGEVQLRLLKKLDGSGESIENFCGYAKVVALHLCADYIGAGYPEWQHLKNCVRRFIEKSSQFAVWKSPEGEVLCGLTQWQNQMHPAPEGLERFRSRGGEQALRSEIPQKHIRRMEREDWNEVLAATFREIGAPIEIDELISVLAAALGVEEIEETSSSEDEEITVTEERRPPYPLPYSSVLTRERLLILWAEITQLLPRHRAAYLLNMSDGEIGVFPHHRIATIRQIGAALELKTEQFEALWAELPDADRAQAAILPNDDEKFAFLWRYLPLDDNQIARMMGGARSQVIGYRNKALERIRRHVR